MKAEQYKGYEIVATSDEFTIRRADTLLKRGADHQVVVSSRFPNRQSIREQLHLCRAKSLIDHELNENRAASPEARPVENPKRMGAIQEIDYGAWVLGFIAGVVAYLQGTPTWGAFLVGVAVTILFIVYSIHECAEDLRQVLRTHDAGRSSSP